MTAADPDAAALEALRLIGPAPDNWVPIRDGIDHDVVIVGGGQTGSTFSFALARAGIRRVSVLDAAPNEALSGVWLTRARMNKLRTPKNLPGPELGIPALSFQAWYESRHGRDAYEAIDRIARKDWAGYLAWYRRILGIPIRYGVRLKRIEPADDHFRLHLASAAGETIETTRKIILGNGVAGFGRPFVPEFARALPRGLWSHTADDIDFTALRGKTIAVVGGAASAFDAAGVALENGADAVHLFVRRAEIPSVPISRVRGYPGAYDNYPQLPDAVRWHQAFRFRSWGSTPPKDAVERVIAFPNFRLHLASPWTGAIAEDGEVRTEIGGETFRFDHVIFGTGYEVDPTQRPELADFAEKILLWRDRYTPPAAEREDGLGRHPYLGLGHELQERDAGTAPYLKDIHVYNAAGFVSFGLPIGDVPSIKRDVPAVVARISRDLFFADFDHHAARFEGTLPADFEPDLYAGSVWRRPRIAAE